MKRVLSIAAASLLLSVAAPALAQTSIQGGASGEGSTVLQPGSSGSTSGEASGTASGSGTLQPTDPGVTGSIDLSAEQQTEMRTILSEGATPVEGDFEISVGAMVPDTVTVQPLPPQFVEVVPQYEGYRYFVLADGRIVIVEPDTLEVVYVLES